jgi:tetrahydromethanopterin S-methyltransferase subunit D
MVMFRLTCVRIGDARRAWISSILGIGLAGLSCSWGLLPLAVTVVGIPLAIVGLATFATGIYAANIVVGALIGHAIVRGHHDLDWRGFARPLVAGLAIVFVALALPYLGGVLRFVALSLGFGVIVERSWTRYRA